jgi:hypothetical protein
MNSLKTIACEASDPEGWRPLFIRRRPILDLAAAHVALLASAVVITHVSKRASGTEPAEKAPESAKKRHFLSLDSESLSERQARHALVGRES